MEVKLPNASSGLADPTIGSAVRKISSGDSKTRSINGVALMNYTLLNRYIVNASLGLEGNSTMVNFWNVSRFVPYCRCRLASGR